MERNLIIGVTGSPAAYNLPNYIIEFYNYFSNIKVIISKAAEKFINADAMLNLCDDVLLDDVPNNEMVKYNHIKLCEWADRFIILPATANIIGKLANGIADDFLSTLLLSYGPDVYICPNTNKRLWENCIVQDNIQKLKRYQYNIIGPCKMDSFELANKKISKQYVIPPISEVINALNLDK